MSDTPLDTNVANQPIMDGQRLKCVGNVTASREPMTMTPVLCHPRDAERVSQTPGPLYVEAYIVDSKGVHVSGCWLALENRT